MHANVHITVFEGDKIVDQREGHNVWVSGGREYLAKLVTFDSPLVSTLEGSVDLVGAFPAITDEWLIVRIGYHTGMIEYRVTFSSPPDVATLLAQIDAQTSGMTPSTGGGNGLVLTSDAPTSVEIVAGTAMVLLGVIPHLAPPAGYTTTPLEDRRVKYMGFGIGSNRQSLPTVGAPPLSVSYPPGFDPHATTGDQYKREFPLDPLISSLERPVRVSGGSLVYPGDPADVWLVQDPDFISYVPMPGVMSYHGVVDAAAGDMLYGPFTEMPLSEVGLFLSDSNVNDAFNVGKLVAYYSFDTILLTPNTKMELVWTVSF